MAWIAAATVGAGLIGAKMSSNAAKSAANTQSQAADAGIAEQRRQFDAMQQLLAPYQNAGTQALTQQLNLGGMNGAAAQQAAIQQIEQGPQFGAMVEQGEEAILQNASATGGLRGGNTQGALAQFRPQVLNSLIDQQYQRLGGLTTMGQNSAAMVGNAGMQTANNVTNLLGQQGAAQAGGQLASGQAFGNFLGGVGTLGGAIMTGAVANPFARSPQAGAPTTSIRPIARPF